MNQDFLNPAASALVNQKTTSTAVFGQAEYSLNDRWAVTVGGRYTDDDKDLTVDSANPGGSVLPGAISVSDSFFNWDVGGQYNDGQYDNVGNNYINLLNLANATGPSFRDDDGILRCGTPDNCKN